MRPDQRLRLAVVSEKLAEVVISDVDPENWTASGITLGAMTQAQRGDAAWCRKTAVQSVALLVRIEQLLGSPDEPPRPPGATSDDPEAEIKGAEKRAAAMVAELTERIGSRATSSP